MPLPGDNNSFGRKKGSYTPGDDKLDNTPYKPVPLAFQQADGTIPADTIDRNGNMQSPSSRREQPEKRRRQIFVAIAVIVVLILLALIIALSICLGTDICKASTSGTSKAEPQFQARVKGSLTSPVIPEPGHAPFGEHLTAVLAELNSTASNAPLTNGTTTLSPINATAVNHRRKRDDGVERRVNGTSRPSDLEIYLAEKIKDPLFQSIESSALCQGNICSDLTFDSLRLLDNEELASNFSWVVGSNEPMVMNPELIDNVTAAAAQNFSSVFSTLFPGYRLGDVNLSFDLLDMCNYSSVFCYNFTGINDTIPTPSTPTPTSTIQSTTITDRSVLLPDIVQLFNSTDAVGSSTTAAFTTSRYSTAIMVAPSTPAPGLADCSRFGFLCADQSRRVGNYQRCDGVVQCSDGSDEASCEQCRTSFSCPNRDNSWLCQRGKIFCDSKSTCPTSVDESGLHCKNICAPSEYNCQDSKICIPMRWLCDGDAQCPQGDDEIDCHLPSKCNNNAFFCVADSRCIAPWTKCDGVRDCSDGADEASCSCVECSGDSVALCSAPYGRCIQRRQVCDGKSDCPNGEDEMNCRR